MKINNVVQLTNNPYLNHFVCDVDYENGNNGKYYFASRNGITNIEATNPSKDVSSIKKNAVTIAGLTQDCKLILIKQFRVPVGDYVYELPSGLIEDGEDVISAAKRELKEETGFEIYSVDESTNASFTSPGAMDETNVTLYCTVYGKPSTDGNEPTENIRVCVCDLNEAIRILNEEKISTQCQTVLMLYIANQTFKRLT